MRTLVYMLAFGAIGGAGSQFLGWPFVIAEVAAVALLVWVAWEYDLL